MEDKNTVTIRISKACMNFVKGIACNNNISNSEQINTIVKTYEHIVPSYIHMDGFINKHYNKAGKEENLFTYETLYILYKYAISKSNKYKNYYHFSALLSKWLIVFFYVETHMEIDGDYDGGPNAEKSKEVSRFLFGEKQDLFTEIAADIIKKVKNQNNMYGEKLTNYISIVCLKHKQLEVLLDDKYLKSREDMLFKLTKELRDDFSDEFSSIPYISFSQCCGIKHTFSRILIDYYENPNGFIIPSYIDEKFICDLLDILHNRIALTKEHPYTKSVTSALKICLEVAKLEMYKKSYYGYFINKLESKKENLLEALKDDISTFEQEKILSRVTAEFVTRVPFQICDQTLERGCNFLEFSRVRQVTGENFLDIFWCALEYVIDEDGIPLLITPNNVLDYGGQEGFISDWKGFYGSYITVEGNPFSINISEPNLKQIQCQLKYQLEQYIFDIDINVETLNKLSLLKESEHDYFQEVVTSKTGVTIIAYSENVIQFKGKNFNFSINKDISQKLFEIIEEFKKSKYYEDVLLVNRLHYGEL